MPVDPINMSVQDITMTSATLKLSENEITPFRQDLNIKIDYKSQWDSDNWHVSIRTMEYQISC